LFPFIQILQKGG